MVIESGQPVLIKNTAGAISFRNQADTLDLNVNVLTALTPAFANWSVNPGTAADIVDELSDASLTTSGTGAAGNNTIIYNIGASRRRMLYVKCNRTDYQIDISDDGAAWKSLIYRPSVAYTGITGLGKFQYVRYLVNGVGTTSDLKLRCYNIN